jgi:hypothetical protein
MEDSLMRCHHCGIREISAKKRPLCKTCYTYLHFNGDLKQYKQAQEHKDSAMEKFISRLVNKFSNEFIGDIEKLGQDHSLNMAKIGIKYGITRERVRQIFNKYNGFAFTQIKNKISCEKKEIKRAEKTNLDNKVVRFKLGSNQLKGTLTEKRVRDICRFFKYKVNAPTGGESDLFVNGYRVEVKSSHKTWRDNKGKQEYYHFSISAKQSLMADFFVLHCVPVDDFYIIKNEIKKEIQKSFYIPSRRKNKYFKHKGAWHILKSIEEKNILEDMSI